MPIKVWNEELGEWYKPQQKEVSSSKKMKDVIDWANARRATPFINLGKQLRALAICKANGIPVEEVKIRWMEMEEDPFWSKTGFDFMNVVSSFDKKPWTK